MYEVPLCATSSADWAQSIELTDARTNLPLTDLEDAAFKLAVDDRKGRTVLTRSTADGTITRPEPNIVQWIFKPSEMAGLCDGTVYRVGLTVETAGGTTQILIGSLTFIDGIVAP